VTNLSLTFKMTAVTTKVLVTHLPPWKVSRKKHNHFKVILIICIVTTLLIFFFEGQMFSHLIVAKITSVRGTLHCHKTRISCGDQLGICGLYTDVGNIMVPLSSFLLTSVSSTLYVSS
jgi:hypothetical protein